MILRDWEPGLDWGVWIGIRLVVGYYDGSYTLFDRSKSDTYYRGTDREAMLADAYTIQDPEAMGQVFEMGYSGPRS